MTVHLEGFGKEGGPVVLFLHGMPSAADSLRELALGLSDRAWTVLAHLPGYGQSPALRPYDFEASQQLLEGALRPAIGDRALHLVGYSAGAYRAFDLLARGNLKVASVAALAGVPAYPPPAQHAMLEIAGHLRAGMDPRVAGPGMLAPEHRGDAASLAQMDAWMTACPAEVLADEMAAAAQGPSHLEAVAASGLPFLFRVGEHDERLPLVRAMAETLGAELQIARGAGHALPLEDHAGSLASLRAFLPLG